MFPLVPENLEIDPFEMGSGAQFIKFGTHGAGNADDIATRRALDFDAEGLASIDAIEPILLRRFQRDRSNITQSQAVLGIDDQIASRSHQAA
jgi:hypothetical protein